MSPKEKFFCYPLVKGGNNMINEVILVGKIKNLEASNDTKKELLLEVERPFKEVEGRVSDIFVCQLWHSIFKKVVDFCSIGDLLAIKGRIICEEKRYLIMAENVVMLNKSKEKV